MPSELLERLTKEAKQLSSDEQGRLLKILERTLSDEVTRRLVAKGLINRVPPPPTEESIKRYESWNPIAIQGKPLSETLIEDRR